MLLSFKSTPKRIVAGCCSLLLTLLLAACAGGITSTFVIQKPSPTATSIPIATPMSTLTVYAGKGFSIGYPQRWKVTTSGTEVDFTDASGLSQVTILRTSDTDGEIDAGTFINAEIDAVKKQMKNTHTEPLPPTMTVSGESWIQKSVSGTETSNGVDADIQMVTLSDNHPAHATNTQNFTILYVTTKAGFATGYVSFFQQMLKSFKFR